MNKIKNTILAISIVAFIVTIALLWNEHKDNITYKTYLSDILSNKVSPLISSISKAEGILSEVINNQTINKSQASSLSSNFNSIKSQNESIIDMGVRLNKIKRNKIVRIVTTNAKLAEYFKNMGDALEAEEVIQLTTMQLKGFKEFLSLASEYKKMAKSSVLGVTETGVNGEYWNKYFVDGVDKEYWTDFINAMEDVSPEYKDFALLNNNTNVLDIK